MNNPFILKNGIIWPKLVRSEKARKGRVNRLARSSLGGQDRIESTDDGLRLILKKKKTSPTVKVGNSECLN